MSIVIYKTGDDVSTDTIYPGRFMATVLPSETPDFAFADDIQFNQKLKDNKFQPNPVLIGGNNFGCGSSREQAASCLKGYDIQIIAKSFARIFLQNAVNLGLNIIIAPQIEGDEGDEIEIKDGKVINKTKNKTFSTVSLGPTQQEVMNVGGLISYTRKRLMKT